MPETVGPNEHPLAIAYDNMVATKLFVLNRIPKEYAPFENSFYSLSAIETKLSKSIDMYLAHRIPKTCSYYIGNLIRQYNYMILLHFHASATGPDKQQPDTLPSLSKIPRNATILKQLLAAVSAIKMTYMRDKPGKVLYHLDLQAYSLNHLRNFENSVLFQHTRDVMIPVYPKGILSSINLIKSKKIAHAFLSYPNVAKEQDDWSIRQAQYNLDKVTYSRFAGDPDTMRDYLHKLNQSFRVYEEFPVSKHVKEERQLVLKYLSQRLFQMFGSKVQYKLIGSTGMNIDTDTAPVELSIQYTTNTSQTYNTREATKIREGLKTNLPENYTLVSATDEKLIFTCKNTTLHVTFYNYEEIANAELFVNYCNYAPLLRSLTRAIITWARNRHLIDEHNNRYLTRWSLCVMAIHFMQVHNFLPVLQPSSPLSNAFKDIPDTVTTTESTTTSNTTTPEDVKPTPAAPTPEPVAPKLQGAWASRTLEITPVASSTATATSVEETTSISTTPTSQQKTQKRQPQPKPKPYTMCAITHKKSSLPQFIAYTPSYKAISEKLFKNEMKSHSRRVSALAFQSMDAVPKLATPLVDSDDWNNQVPTEQGKLYTYENLRIGLAPMDYFLSLDKANQYAVTAMKRYTRKPKVDVATLFSGFFAYYSYRFDRGLMGISIRCGHLVWAEQYRQLHPTQPLYFCIENPFAPTNILTDKLSALDCDAFFLEMKRIAMLLREQCDISDLFMALLNSYTQLQLFSQHRPSELNMDKVDYGKIYQHIITREDMKGIEATLQYHAQVEAHTRARAKQGKGKGVYTKGIQRTIFDMPLPEDAQATTGSDDSQTSMTSPKTPGGTSARERLARRLEKKRLLKAKRAEKKQRLMEIMKAHELEYERICNEQLLTSEEKEAKLSELDAEKDQYLFMSYAVDDDDDDDDDDDEEDSVLNALSRATSPNPADYTDYERWGGIVFHSAEDVYDAGALSSDELDADFADPLNDAEFEALIRLPTPNIVATKHTLHIADTEDEDLKKVTTNTKTSNTSTTASTGATAAATSTTTTNTTIIHLSDDDDDDGAEEYDLGEMSFHVHFSPSAQLLRKNFFGDDQNEDSSTNLQNALHALQQAVEDYKTDDENDASEDDDMHFTF